MTWVREHWGWVVGLIVVSALLWHEEDRIGNCMNDHAGGNTNTIEDCAPSRY